MHNWLFKIVSKDEKDRLDEGTKVLIKVLFYIALAILALIVALLYIDYVGHKGSQSPYLGTFGDFFGGILNPLLTFGTLIGLSATIVLQRIALRTSRLQAFETTLFNMLELHNNIVQQLRFNKSMIGKRSSSNRAVKASLSIGAATYTTAPDSEGRGVFKAILSALGGVVEVEKRNIVTVYKEDLQNNHNYVLGHYFRNLYQILRLVRRNEGDALNLEQAQEYTAIIRSQLSAHELALLFLNCHRGVVDGGKFRDLLIRYELLEHLPLSIEVDSGNLKSLDFIVDQEFLDYYLKSIPKRLESTQGIYQEFQAGAYGTNNAVRDYLAVRNKQAVDLALKKSVPSRVSKS